MKKWLFLILACTSSISFSAQENDLGCKRLRIALDPRLSSDVIERDSGSGQPHVGAPAIPCRCGDRQGPHIWCPLT